MIYLVLLNKFIKYLLFNKYLSSVCIWISIGLNIGDIMVSKIKYDFCFYKVCS